MAYKRILKSKRIYTIPILILMVLLSCKENSIPKIKAKDISENKAVTTITYRITQIGRRLKPDDLSDLVFPDTNFRLVKIADSNSVINEVAAQFGFIDTVSVYRHYKNESEAVSQTSEWSSLQFDRPVEMPLIPDSLDPQFTDTEEFVFSRKCKTAIFRLFRMEYKVWFAEDPTLSDYTGALIAHDKIPGTILRCDRVYYGSNEPLGIRYEIVDVSRNEGSVAGMLPKSFLRMRDSDDARNLSLTKFDSFCALRDTATWKFKDKFTGKWFVNAYSNVTLSIERYGESYIAESKTGGRKRISYGIVRFYENKLCLFINETWIFFELDSKDELICISNRSLRLKRQKPAV